jgi:AhpD family alkylhydroperoxidase
VAKTRFSRRIYTIASFQEAVEGMLDHLPDLGAAARSGQVDKAFAERIMLAVTQVNGCRYCHYGHTRAALAAGVTPAEIQSLIAGELDGLPPDEWVALLFAQHYAETEGHPDPEAWRRVVDTYGQETARDVMAYIRMIMMGNLLGNTFDALLNRLAFRPAAGSSLWQELGVLLGTFVLIPAGLLRRWI